MKKLLIAASVFAISAAPALAMDKMMSMDDKATMMSQYFMKKMDTNGDGMISKEEQTAGMDKMFKDADTNGDGMLSMDELKACKKKEMEEMMADKGAMSSSMSTSTTTTKTMMKK